MKWILLAFMTGSSGTGPTMPMYMSAEFNDRPACESAAKQLENIGRNHRVLWSKNDWVCVPSASAEPCK